MAQQYNTFMGTHYRMKRIEKRGHHIQKTDFTLTLKPNFAILR